MASAQQYSPVTVIYSEAFLRGEAPIKGKIAAAFIAAFILVVALIVASFFIGQTLVDIFLILVALLSLVAFLLLGYAAIQLIGLVKEVRTEVKVLTGTASETLNEVRGTARFVSDNVVQPVSRAVGFISAGRATVKAFTEPLYKRKS